MWRWKEVGILVWDTSIPDQDAMWKNVVWLELEPEGPEYLLMVYRTMRLSILVEGLA